MMSGSDTRAPLARRVIIGVLVGELALGLVVALTVGTLAAVALAERHREATHDVTSTLAAALIPVIADQQPARTAATLENIVDAAGLEDVRCAHVVDSSGEEVAVYGESHACEVEPEGDAAPGPWTLLMENRLVSQDIEVGGLVVATVRVGLSPPPLSEVFTVPVAASAIVLLAVMMVSVPWTWWLVQREVVEPLEGLEGYASRIAEGDLEPQALTATSAEIARLQEALASMASQLGVQREELRGSYEQITEAYESLEAAKHAIERLATVKEDFVAVAAHEIRAPLATIRLHAEMLRGGQVSELNEAGIRAVAAIHSAASRLGSITSDLMDSALLERGMMPIQLDTVWLDELVEEAVRDAEVSARARGMTLRLAGDLPEVVVQGDALRLRQVIDNLLYNAIKYSLEGGEIFVAVGETGHDVLLEVSDSGPGIDASERSRLFTLFGRVDSGDSRQAAGLGLGLAISARIVEAHGGSIELRDNASGGSVFAVKLPKQGPPAGDSPAGLEARVTQRGDSR
jgi:signal transduction histidine kinase